MKTLTLLLLCVLFPSLAHADRTNPRKEPAWDFVRQNAAYSAAAKAELLAELAHFKGGVPLEQQKAAKRLLARKDARLMEILLLDFWTGPEIEMAIGEEPTKAKWVLPSLLRAMATMAPADGALVPVDRDSEDTNLLLGGWRELYDKVASVSSPPFPARETWTKKHVIAWAAQAVELARQSNAFEPALLAEMQTTARDLSLR